MELTSHEDLRQNQNGSPKDFDQLCSDDKMEH